MVAYLVLELACLEVQLSVELSTMVGVGVVEGKDKLMEQTQSSWELC